MWNALKNLSGFQKLLVGIAFMAIISQLSINAYYELYGSLKHIDDRQKSEVEGFYKSVTYLERLGADSLLIAGWTGQRNQLEARNESELSATGKLRHVDNVRMLNDQIKQASESRLSWIDSEIEKINAKYEDMRNDPLARWGGFGLIFVFEFLALGFGFLAPRRPVKFQQYLALAFSVYAQFASCSITERGLQLLVGDNGLAALYAYAFMIQIPAFYWFGGLDIEEYGKKYIVQVESLTKPEMNAKTTSELKAKITEHTEEESLIHRKTIRSSLSELQMPISLTSAVMLYRSGKISKENGWSQRRIAREFADGDLNKVHRLIAGGSTSPSEIDIPDTVKQFETE